MLSTLCLLVAAAGPLVFTSGTEAPQKVERVDLPPACAVCPPGRVTCSHYQGFMVREVDLGEMGAAALAIVPLPRKGPAPTCSRDRVPGELPVTGGAENFFGYFEGARGRFAFFRSEERDEEGRWSFAAFDASTGRRVLLGSALGEVRVTGRGPRVGLSFLQRSAAPCSPLVGGDACWQRIRAELGVGDPLPDCAAAYRAANEEAARGACEGEAPAVARCVDQQLRLRPAYPALVPPALDHEVDYVDLSAAELRPATGARVLGCRPPR
jgi:hypothetical protein